MVEWNNVNIKLPEDEDGEIPYLVAFWDENPDDFFEDDKLTDDDLSLDIGYHYGNNHWKNVRCNTIWVRYWIEIPEIP